MKAEQFLFLSMLTLYVYASPARPDCGVIKIYAATDNCGVTYGGVWTACESGMMEMPTFSIPSCSITAPATPIITPAPPVDTSTSCQHVMVCIDGVASCGNTRFEECWDTCSEKPALSTTPCTLPPSTVTTGPWSNLTLPQGNPPARHKLAICNDKPYMCAPQDQGW